MYPRKDSSSSRLLSASAQSAELANNTIAMIARNALMPPDEKTLITTSRESPIREKPCQKQQRGHDQKETVRVLSQRNTTYIHAKQARHQVDRQGQHSY